MGDSGSAFTPLFKKYFERDVAKRAASSLSKGAQIQFVVQRAGVPDPEETFFFQKPSGTPDVQSGNASGPEVTFTLTPAAAQSILDHPSDEIGPIGVNILKLVISGDPELKVRLKLHAGVLGLVTKGYLGVIAAGGAEFAAFLAGKGLGNLSAIKDAIQKLKKGEGKS